MKIALGVSGGIAAYKAAEIVRLLQDHGFRVQVIMTRAAQEFVRPLTFAALSGEKVITDLFGNEAGQPNIDSAVEHIAVAQSIDALVVVPATADVLAKFAQGIANDFLAHTVPRNHRAGRCGSRDERQYVEPRGHASQPSHAARSRRAHRRTRRRLPRLLRSNHCRHHRQWSHAHTPGGDLIVSRAAIDRVAATS